MKTLIALTLSLVLRFSIASEVALEEFTAGNKLFSGSLYKELRKDSPGNILYSPFSIQTVLALTQSGAYNETASEIRSSLRLPNSTDSTESAYKLLLQRFKGTDRYALHTANKIYVKNSYQIKEDFKKVAEDVYQAGIENIDFTQKENAADAINSWVENVTENKIHELIDPKSLEEETRIILINGLYFKGKWQNMFESLATKKKDFYRTAKDVVQVDTMHNIDLYNYYESPELKAKFLEMPYRGKDVSMIIVLPDEVEGLASLENQIDRVFVAPKFTQERVSVSLPKFTIEAKILLKPILQNLGIKLVFTEAADLSGIAGNNGELYVNDVIQKAFINVTESGTEAAAATAAKGVVTLSLPPERITRKFRAHHPFLFYIKLKNVVLFVGRYVNNL